MRKRMKLPNNFSSIVKLPGRRRKPWAVRKKIDGKYKYLGYFETYEKALTFLVEYNKDPSVYAPSLITFAEIYQQEMAERCKKIQPVTARSYRTAFNNKGANITSVKRILGHADKDVTTGVYTHKDIRQLKKAVDLL